MKIELPYGPAIQLLGIYPDKPVIHKDACTPMSTGVLFTTAKTWKQLNCQSTDEWFKKIWCVYIYTHTHTHTHNGVLPTREKECDDAIGSNIDEPRAYHTK